MEQLIVILLIITVLAILYEYRYIFSFLRFRWLLKSVEKNIEKPPKNIIQKICSTCGTVMEEGNLISPVGIYWSKDVPSSMLYNSRPPFYRPTLGSEPLTVSGRFFSDRVPNLKAYRCRKCGTILVDSRSQNLGID